MSDADELACWGAPGDPIALKSEETADGQRSPFVLDEDINAKIVLWYEQESSSSTCAA